MKALMTVVALLIASQTYAAGRESHGLVAMGYRCVSQTTSYVVTFPFNLQQIQSGLLTQSGKELATLSCDDHYSQVVMGSQLKTTAVCSVETSPYLLELQESQSEAQVLLYKQQENGSSTPVETLSCN